MIDAILAWIQTVAPWAGTVLMSLGGLVVVGQVFVSLTPSPKDDAWFNKLYTIPLLGDLMSALAKFAPIQKKPKA